MTVKIPAPAKINPALDVVGKREDGYHLLQMVMQTINLYDEITVSRAPQTELVCNNPKVPQDNSNICMAAWRALKTACKITGGVKIEINKKIPLAAGLAGGSTDGAAVMLALNREFELGLSMAELQKAAASLGADVPFCLQKGTALAEGIGDILTPLTPCPKIYILALNAGFEVSTVEVYKNLRLPQIKNRPCLKDMLNAIEAQDTAAVIASTGNVLEQSAFELFPELAVTKKRIADLGLKALMSGSGGTMLGLTADREQAAFALHKLEDDFEFAGIFETVQA